MKTQNWRWLLGLVYIFAVATIWIAASFVVQSVVDGGVSPFFITYICNSLFLVYIPLVEIDRLLEDKYGSILFWWKKKETSSLEDLGDSEAVILLENNGLGVPTDTVVLDVVLEEDAVNNHGGVIVIEDANVGLDAKGRWTRTRVAKVSLLVCPFWFLAQLTFNLSLKYTTVTSNSILNSASSLFTFLVALVFLGEKFTWVKLFSVLLCMGGTIIVSLGDSETGSSSVAPNPALGDVFSLLSAALYAVYITLIRKKLPDEKDEKSGQASNAQFFGFLGLFNLLIFLPVVFVLNFAKLEPFNILTWKQLGLIIGKGLLDNVLSDYLWVKAILLTSTTVATAGLTIQVPLAAVVDSITGNTPHLLDYIGAAAVMVGLAGIIFPPDTCLGSEQGSVELEMGNLSSAGQDHQSSR